jgi:hypothetical protein
MTEYNAKSIKILTPEQVSGRFGWAYVIQLSDKYPSSSPEFISRGLEACRRCSIPPDYFIEKYLDNDASVPKNTDVEEAYKEILHEEWQSLVATPKKTHTRLD